MSPLVLWGTIGAVALVTFAFRVSLLHLFGRVEVPPSVERALRFVPPAVLAVLVLPALVYPEGALDLSLTNARLWAGLLAAGTAWGTRSVVLTLAAGMLALWTLQAVLPT